MATSRAALISRTTSRRAGVGNITNALSIDSAGFLRDLQAHMRQMEVRSENALVATGFAVQNVARGLCPVDTGRLRSSIKSRSGRDSRGFYVEIGTNVTYAAFVEFGTWKTRAQPFLIPALAQATGFMRAAVV